MFRLNLAGLCVCLRAKSGFLTSRPIGQLCRASDFFQDWWAEVTHGAKNGGSFSEMMGPSKLTTSILYLHTDTDTCMHICILTADYTVKPVLQCHLKKDQLSLNAGQKYCRMLQGGAFCNPFDLH